MPQNLAAAEAELTDVAVGAKGLLGRTLKTAFDLVPTGDQVVGALNAAPVPAPVPIAPVAPVAPEFYYQYYQDANGQVVVIPAQVAPAAVAQPAPVATVPAVAPVNVPEVAPISPEGRAGLATFLRVMADIVDEGQFDKAQVRPLLGFLEGLLD